MPQVRVEPASGSTDGETVVRIATLADLSAAPTVAVGPEGIFVDGELVPVPVPAPGLARTTLRRKHSELVVRFPAPFHAVDHWWGSRPVINLPKLAKEEIDWSAAGARTDLDDLGLGSPPGPFQLRWRGGADAPVFSPPTRGAAAETRPAAPVGYSLAATSELKLGAIIAREAPLISAADEDLCADVFSDQEARDEPAAQLAAQILALKRRRETLPLRRLALLGALLPEAAPDDAAALFASLAPAWRECTDQAEIAEVARVLEENATFVEEPVVFFGFSFLHHSCVPNAALLMDGGPDVTLVALSEVPAGATLTVDKLGWPYVYSPAWVRSERLGEMGITDDWRDDQ